METRWLTYDGIAQALGITPDSARRLVARNKQWPRKPGNDGRVLVGIPAERLERPPAAVPDAKDDVADDAKGDAGGDITHAVGILTQHIERIEKELSEAKAELAAERVKTAGLQQTVAQLDAIKAVLDAERARVAEWQAIADRFAGMAERRSWWPFGRRRA